MSKFFETISEETKLKSETFISNHPNELVDYWSWREALSISLEIYKDLELSTKEYGEKFDEIMEPYKGKSEFSQVEVNVINNQLSEISVVKSEYAHELLNKLSKYRYF